MPTISKKAKIGCSVGLIVAIIGFIADVLGIWSFFGLGRIFGNVPIKIHDYFYIVQNMGVGAFSVICGLPLIFGMAFVLQKTFEVFKLKPERANELALMIVFFVICIGSCALLFVMARDLAGE